MMRLASILLVCVLLSTSVISGTYAKYTSTASGSDKARVAKWDIVYTGSDAGVDITGRKTVNFDLFNTVYEIGTATDDEHVANGAGETIIAPGTAGNFTFTVTNNSEVDARIDIDLKATNDAGIPIEYSYDGTNYYADFEKINERFNSVDLKYLDGGDNVENITIYWRWAFVGTESTNFTGTQTDVTDTKLGIAAQSAAQEVTIEATIVATQIN